MINRSLFPFKCLKPLLAVSAAGLLLPQTAYAATAYDMSEILRNLRSILNPLIILILVISFLAGMYMVFRGLGMLKQFGMPLTQMTRPGELGGPLVYIFVGAFLIYLPTSTDVVTQTIFGGDQVGIFSNNRLDLAAAGKASDELLGYLPVSIEEQWADLADTLVLYIQFIGFIAFVRGWFMISKAGQPGVQPGSIAKGMIHIFGGILAVNFVPLVTILKNTIFGT